MHKLLILLGLLRERFSIIYSSESEETEKTDLILMAGATPWSCHELFQYMKEKHKLKSGSYWKQVHAEFLKFPKAILHYTLLIEC